MIGTQFEAAMLQSLMQGQVDREVEYQRLDEAAEQRIVTIDARLAAIDTELDRRRGIVG